MTLAAPGGAGELRALAGRLLGRPLDMDRPLWRLARIDGLAGGGWAIVGQAHHALVDGIAAIQVALLLFDGVARRNRRRGRRSRRPGTARVAQAGAARRGADRAAARCASPACPAARSAPPPRRSPGPQPPTALDRSVTHRREVAFADAPLEELRDAGAQARGDDQRRRARGLVAGARRARSSAAATGRRASRRSCRSTRAPARPGTSATTSRSSRSTSRSARPTRSRSCARSATPRRACKERRRGAAAARAGAGRRPPPRPGPAVRHARRRPRGRVQRRRLERARPAAST